MSQEIDRQEVESSVDRIRRRNELDDLLQGESDWNRIGGLLKQVSELEDDEVEDLISKATVSQDPVTHEEATEDVATARRKAAVFQDL